MKEGPAAARAARAALYACAACAALLASCAGAPPAKVSGSFSLEPRPLSAVIDRIVTRLDTELGPGGGRLAVAAFARTGAEEGERFEFGEYFSDTLASAVRSGIPRARLYERKNLDLILRENSLAVSGLVDEGQALAIGNLVPIDALLAGTYTPLETAVDVNCRLVDIATGQILFTHADRIRIDADVAAVLARERAGGGQPGPGQLPKPVEPSAEELCAEKADEVRGLLRDLSAPGKVRAVVSAASAIPFDTGCGSVHVDVIASFRRYGVLDAEYRAFLLTQLAAVRFPSEDGRALEILKYLAADGSVDEEEWRAGLAVLGRSSAGDLSRFLVVLLRTNDETSRGDADDRLTLARVEELLASVEKGEVGLPVAVDVDTAFFEVLEAFNFIYASDNHILAALYEKEGKKLSARPAVQKRVMTFLAAMYPRERDEKIKLKMLDWIARAFLARPRDEELASDFFSFLRSFEVTEYKRKNPQELAAHPPGHLPVLVRSTRELFCPLVALTKFRSQLEERVDFCLVNALECPGVVPGPAEAAAMLGSRDWYARLRGARMLELMGPRAAPAQAAMVERFADEEGGSSAEIAVFQNSIVRALGSIRASSRGALELLLGALSSLHNGVSSAAAQSLAAIGAPAVPVLIRGLQGDAGGVQYYSASALALIGPPASAALPELERLAQSTNNDLRTIAEKAIRAVRGK
jgi:hypothetical protein